MFTDAFERVGHPRPDGILYTCEHASNRVPAPWRPRPADRRLLAQHWGYDIGGAHLTRELARQGRDAAVLARFSRLLCDANRAPDDPTLALASTDDGDPRFNRVIDRAARVERFHRPFHEAVDAWARRVRTLVSIHTFTPVFRGNRRAMEAGILFDKHDDLSLALVDAMRAEGFVCEANEPYSGKVGLIYSASRHGDTHGLPYLEIEVRQDLVAAQAHAHRVAHRIWRALHRVGIASRPASRASPSSSPRP